MGARFICRACRAPLPKRGARCRGCGWAADYDPRYTRQQRELVLGIGLVLVAILLLIGITLAYVYVNPIGQAEAELGHTGHPNA